jgi:lipooligosaccharide transport system permease protein
MPVRFLSHPAVPVPRRALRIVQRNLFVYQHGWMTIVSGFFEPLFYLLSIGVGVGALVREADGVPYTAFVAPGLLAASCMNGAISDGFFNVFFKLHYEKTYDGMLATPMRVPDIALGEMLWATMRGSIYAAGFLLVMLGLGAWRDEPILRSWTALLAFPAAVLVAASFSSIALLLTSLARTVEDFDLVMGLVVMPMFLFSGTFFPVAQLTPVVQVIFQMVPLFHAVELLRALTTGRVDLATVWHAVFLMFAGMAALAVAMRRLERTLVT